MGIVTSAEDMGFSECCKVTNLSEEVPVLNKLASGHRVVGEGSFLYLCSPCPTIRQLLAELQRFQPHAYMPLACPAHKPNALS